MLIAIIGGFSIGYMPSVIVVESNSALTFQNLLANQILFKWAIAGDIVVIILEIILSVMLYQLLKKNSITGMTIATYCRLGMAVIMGVNLINYMIPVIIMTQPEYLESFSLIQLESLTLLFFKAHKYGELAWQILFAMHLFMLGYVILKTEQMSKYLGILMLIGSVGYGGDSFIQFTFIKSEILSLIFTLLLVLAVIAEFWFAFWLLFKGMNTKEII